MNRCIFFKEKGSIQGQLTGAHQVKVQGHLATNPRESRTGKCPSSHVLARFPCLGMSTGHRCLFKILTSFPLDVYPAVGLLGHTGALFLISWGNSILVSTVIAPICIPTNTAWGFPFLHNLSNTNLWSQQLRYGNNLNAHQWINEKMWNYTHTHTHTHTHTQGNTRHRKGGGAAMNPHGWSWRTSCQVK